MRQSSFLRALAAVLFTAVCAWTLSALVPGVARCTAAAESTPAASPTAGLELDGIVIRSEQVLSAAGESVNITAENGERLSADAAAAFAGNDSAHTRGSAVFFSGTDGYEYLSPAALSPLTPEGLEDLMNAEPESTAGAYGRLVTGFDWYYAAAPVNGGGENIAEERCKLRFAGFSETLDGEIISSEQGALVIRLTDGAAEYLSLRHTGAELFSQG